MIEATPNGATPLVAYPIPQCTANFATHALPAGQVRVIKPHNLWNTDDTTVLVSENSSSAAGPKWRIAKGNEATGVQSLYKMGEGSGFLSCMRVRATVSAAANGSTSPLYLTVTGLTEAELTGCSDRWRETVLLHKILKYTDPMVEPSQPLPLGHLTMT